MVFSSILFIFFFLPCLLLLYYVLPHRLKNICLLLASLLFYYIGEGSLIVLFLLSISINYVLGYLISLERRSYMWLSLGVLINLSFLLYYKYAPFIIENLQLLQLMPTEFKSNILLPVGISFYTFQGLSYLVDIYRDKTLVQKDPIKLGLFISFFPQLIAGPIIKYSDLAGQLSYRSIDKMLFAKGIQKFIRGLAKKVILSNHLAMIADAAFRLNAEGLSTPSAWLGIIAFALQIYFDFSGYSDMAIGMGKMFGFNFKENFNYPYIATSVRAFWQRWHISLSSWFRDYLYIPLGGSHCRSFKIYRNLIIVFICTGLWHGANWTFLCWGLLHGACIIGERLWPWKKSPIFLQHLYLILVMLFSWVFFKADNIQQALQYTGKLLAFDLSGDYLPFIYSDPYTILLFVAAILFCMPIRTILLSRIKSEWLISIGYILLFVFAISELVQSTYNPFIYFRF